MKLIFSKSEVEKDRGHENFVKKLEKLYQLGHYILNLSQNLH